jgi:membrane-associated protease RseP (regulator of RpoE activity)
MSNNNQNSKAPSGAVTIAVITTIGVLGGALFANWDKVFPQSPDRAGDSTPHSESSPRGGNESSMQVPSDEVSPNARRNCVGLTYAHFPQFFLDVNQPPIFNVGVITTVFAGQPAHAAGLQQGDIVVSINGRPITGIQTMQEIIADLENDETVFIRAFRPSFFSINNQGVEVFGPYTEGTVEVKLQQCSI